MADTTKSKELPGQLRIDFTETQNSADNSEPTSDPAGDGTDTTNTNLSRANTGEATADSAPPGRRKSLREVFAHQAITPITHSLPEIRLNTEPTRVVLFTDSFEEAGLHFEEDPSIRSYFHCPDFHSPKAGCPYCFLGLTRTEVILLPALLVKTREVGVLRIGNSEGPHRLLSMLRPHIQDPAIDRKIVAISRNTNRYSVQVQTVRDGVDLGADAILAFLDQYEKGLIQLVGSFPNLSVDELRQVPTIANQLDVVENAGDHPPHASARKLIAPRSPLNGGSR